MRNPWSGLQPGTLTDRDIRDLAGAGQLIVENFEAHCVRQACYELRASDVFYETGEPREDKRVAAADAGYILRPHTFVTAIVLESIALPNDVVARILTKGQLFSIGILPVNTYADPGFDGRLGITLYNASHRPIFLRPGQAIAKIEFTLLPKAVEDPYKGQHGYHTEIWPIPVQMYATSVQLREAGLRLDSLNEIERSYGPVVGRLERRLRQYESRVWLQIGLTGACFAVLFALYGEISLVLAVGAGIVTNLLTTIGINVASTRFRSSGYPVR